MRPEARLANSQAMFRVESRVRARPNGAAGAAEAARPRVAISTAIEHG